MRTKSLGQSQKGISLVSLLLIAVLGVAVFMIGAQSLPIVLEYQAAIKAVKKAANEGGTMYDIRTTFDRAAQIDDIQSLTGKDLDITNTGEKAIVSFEYDREIPLVGPAYLVYRFKYQTP